MRKGVLWVEVKKCLACKTCELECAVVHSMSRNLKTVITENPISIPRLKVEAAKDFSVPLQCRHCEDAPCVKICPTKALAKSEPGAPVLLNKEYCIGCRFCIQVCPFGVIRMDRNGTAIIKCDLCIERLTRNELPACVSGCPTRAIKFLSVEEYTEKMRKKAVESFVEI